MRMRKKKNLTGRMAACEDVQVLNPEELRGKWREHFECTPDTVLNVEIGCGKGGFIVQMAKQNPDQLFVAVERVESVLLVAMEKAQKEELDNLLFISYDAARLDLVFAPDEADRIYLNFSDPWPPKGQHKRRLTHPAFLSVYQRFLKEEGEICFKTDNRPLFEHSICYLSQFGYGLFDVTFNLHATDTPNVMTEYERNFSLQGRPIYRLVARKMLPDTPMTDVRKIGQYDSKEETEEEA